MPIQKFDAMTFGRAEDLDLYNRQQVVARTLVLRTRVDEISALYAIIDNRVFTFFLLFFLLIYSGY